MCFRVGFSFCPTSVELVRLLHIYFLLVLCRVAQTIWCILQVGGLQNLRTTAATVFLQISSVLTMWAIPSTDLCWRWGIVCRGLQTEHKVNELNSTFSVFSDLFRQALKMISNVSCESACCPCSEPSCQVCGAATGCNAEGDVQWCPGPEKQQNVQVSTQKLGQVITQHQFHGFQMQTLHPVFLWHLPAGRFFLHHWIRSFIMTVRKVSWDSARDYRHDPFSRWRLQRGKMSRYVKMSHLTKNIVVPLSHSNACHRISIPSHISTVSNIYMMYWAFHGISALSS